MATEFTYTISADFPGGIVNVDKLSAAVLGSSIVPSLSRTSISGDTITLVFSTDLSTGENTTLDGDTAAPAGGLIASTSSTPSILDSHQSSSDPDVTDDVREGALAGFRWLNTMTADEFVCLDNAEGAAVWVRTTGNGALVQSVNTSTASVVAATGDIPQDDTIPQNTEGTTVLSLAITPTSTANDLHIRFSCSGSVDGNLSFVVALFQNVDGTVADAIAVTHQGARNQTDLTPQDVMLEHVFSPATTGTYTFEIRIGISAGNFYVNGNSAGNRLFGGVRSAQLIIEEKS